MDTQKPKRFKSDWLQRSPNSSLKIGLISVSVIMKYGYVCTSNLLNGYSKNANTNFPKLGLMNRLLLRQTCVSWVYVSLPS